MAAAVDVGFRLGAFRHDPHHEEAYLVLGVRQLHDEFFLAEGHFFYEGEDVHVGDEREEFLDVQRHGEVVVSVPSAHVRDERLELVCLLEDGAVPQGLVLHVQQFVVGDLQRDLERLELQRQVLEQVGVRVPLGEADDHHAAGDEGVQQVDHGGHETLLFVGGGGGGAGGGGRHERCEEGDEGGEEDAGVHHAVVFVLRESVGVLVERFLAVEVGDQDVEFGGGRGHVLSAAAAKIDVVHVVVDLAVGQRAEDPRGILLLLHSLLLGRDQHLSHSPTTTPSALLLLRLLLLVLWWCWEEFFVMAGIGVVGRLGVEEAGAVVELVVGCAEDYGFFVMMRRACVRACVYFAMDTRNNYLQTKKRR